MPLRVACSSELRTSWIFTGLWLLAATANACARGDAPSRSLSMRTAGAHEGLSAAELRNTKKAAKPDGPTTAPGSPLLLPYSKWPRGVELMIGVVLGVVATFLGLMAYLGCWPHRKRLTPPRIPSATLLRSLDCGRFNLTSYEFKEAFFKQFSWTLHGGSSFRDHDCIAKIFDSHDQQVAHGVGRLMSMPNGEIYLASGGPVQSTDIWCILRRPAPSRRPGQLWDFKVCDVSGATYSEVKQRSETKCLVNDAVSKHMVMTVIGNFTYPVFLSGKRSINVWAPQADGQLCMVARCEAKVEGFDAVASTGVDLASADASLETDTFREITSDSSMYLPPSNVRFVVTTFANVDASLVLAVLLGLQDVHCSGRPDTPAELSSASTGSRWSEFGGMRTSSGGSTVATLGSEGRRQPRFFSLAAKAAAMPPEPESEV